MTEDRWKIVTLVQPVAGPSESQDIAADGGEFISHEAALAHLRANAVHYIAALADHVGTRDIIAARISIERNRVAKRGTLPGVQTNPGGIA